MKIANRDIGIDHIPYIVAEISANHRGSVKEACRLIDAGIDLGADAVKIQCYTAESIAAKNSGIILDGPWKGKDLYELYREAQTPPKMVEELFRYAQKHHITLFASVFDFEGVDLVQKLGAPAIKIASFELVDTPLIGHAAKTGLPMIISTGMGSAEEISDAINCYTVHTPEQTEKNLALLHCVSEYPARPDQANLPALGPLSQYGWGEHVVGLSDHTIGCGVACAATALGARIIEKHLILDRGNGGPDAGFSSEPAEFGLMVRAVQAAYYACQSHAKPQTSHSPYRKSLYVVSDVRAGTPFSKDNVRLLRPARGLPPKLYQYVLAGVATQDIPAYTPLQRGMVSSLD